MQTKTTHFIFSFFAFSFISLLLSSIPAASDPQTRLLVEACTRYNASSTTAFISNLNNTLSDLRSQLNSTSFATATNALVSDPVYGLFQCRDYLSTADCISCFTVAASKIRNCLPASGARIIFDGCYLRYEGNDFFDQGTQVGNSGFCGNQTVSKESGFNDTAGQLLRDLMVATPRISGFYAAVKRDGGGGAVVYGVAQCARTVSESGCGDCLSVAYGNIQKCPPDADGRTLDASCFLRYSNTAFFSANQSMNISPYLSRESKKKKKKAIIGGVVGGVAVVFLLLLLVFVIFARTKKNKKTQKEIIGATELRGPVIFQYDDLKSATRNFSDKNKLGGGGFGDVYKGIMREGKIVAVKRLMVSQSEKVKEDFEVEVKLINNVHHRNLVRLLGCCSKGPELLLVYEFMANNSLDKYLFGERRGTLNWKQRLDIITGTARGLTYLHEEFHIRIIHRDIKPNNILLDDEFQPKIADFGLARLLPGDRSHLSTKFGGTMGYMAPEYAIKGKLSEKADVYSYGMVVLEIISGRKSNIIRHEPVTEYLIEWAWRLYEGGSLMELVDESLDPNELEPNEVKKVIEIGLMCTQSDHSRPTMSNVVVMLLSNGELDLTLTRPNFINSTHLVQTRVANGGSPVATELPASNATVSISELYAR